MEDMDPRVRAFVLPEIAFGLRQRVRRANHMMKTGAESRAKRERKTDRAAALKERQKQRWDTPRVDPVYPKLTFTPEPEPFPVVIVLGERRGGNVKGRIRDPLTGKSRRLFR